MYLAAIVQASGIELTAVEIPEVIPAAQLLRYELERRCEDYPAVLSWIAMLSPGDD
jgi:hypothetical protein